MFAFCLCCSFGRYKCGLLPIRSGRDRSLVRAACRPVPAAPRFPACASFASSPSDLDTHNLHFLNPAVGALTPRRGPSGSGGSGHRALCRLATKTQPPSRLPPALRPAHRPLLRAFAPCFSTFSSILLLSRPLLCFSLPLWGSEGVSEASSGVGGLQSLLSLPLPCLFQLLGHLPSSAGGRRLHRRSRQRGGGCRESVIPAGCLGARGADPARRKVVSEGAGLHRRGAARTPKHMSTNRQEFPGPIWRHVASRPHSKPSKHEERHSFTYNNGAFSHYLT